MKFQKVSSTDSTLTFNVWADSGEMEQQTYGLGEETEEELMTRVVEHFDKSVKARNEGDNVLEVQVAEVFPIIEIKVKGTKEVIVEDQKPSMGVFPMDESKLPPVIPTVVKGEPIK